MNKLYEDEIYSENGSENAKIRAKCSHIEKLIADEGYSSKTIYKQSKSGYGDFNSFFDLLVDCKLAGNKYPTNLEVFNNMKQQINYLKAELHRISNSYNKLQNEIRNLRKEKEELIREK